MVMLLREVFNFLYAALWKQCIPETRLFTQPWPTMCMYFYTTQQDRRLCVNALQF
jgi:hypothetical protein